MRDPKPIEGGRALLFDRLVGRRLHGDEPNVPRVLDLKELKESVRRELERLLNTRCSVPMHLLGEEERTVITYGIPDFSSLSAKSGDDQQLLATIVSDTVTAFEPRLRQVNVTVEPFQNSYRGLLLRIDALLVTGTHVEPVTFVFASNKSEKVEIDESE